MANFNEPWTMRWQVRFQSFRGTQMRVGIFEQGYVGNVVELTGAGNPFETGEDTDSNIFKAIRGQTGYLRVVDTTGSLLEQLMPTNNTQRMVKLMDDTNNTILWRGFLSAEAYSQPWQNGVRMLEFPVKSYLAALEDVTISTVETSSIEHLGYYIVKAFQQLLNSDMQAYSTVYVCDDHNKSPMMYPVEPEKFYLFTQPRVSSAIFFERDSDASDTSTVVGRAYSDIVEKILAIHGLCLRERGEELFFMQYDTALSALTYATFPWSAFVHWAMGTGTPTYTDGTKLAETAVTSLGFAGAKNQVKYLPGARRVALSLSLGGGLEVGVDIPQAPETGGTDKLFDFTGRGTVNRGLLVRHYAPRTDVREQYDFRRYIFHWTGDAETSYYQFDSYATAADYSANLWTSVDGDYTGAVPCQFQEAVIRRETPGGTLIDYFPKPGTTPHYGMLIKAVDRMRISDNPDGINSYAWSIKSSVAYTLDDGYLNLDFSTFFLQSNGNTGTLRLRLFVKIGGEYVGCAVDQPIVVEVTDGKMKTNKTSDMDVEGTSGYYIPLDRSYEGKIEVIFCNSLESRFGNMAPYILYNLNVEYMQSDLILASQRDENRYTTLLTTSGFSGEIEEDLGIGTFNNNKRSNVFLLDNDLDYIQAIPYAYPNDIIDERPEPHLLERMAQHYAAVRRNYTCTVWRGSDFYLSRWIYDDRRYVGIVAKTHWREDKEDISLLEVEDASEYYD